MKILRSEKHVFWEALIITLVIFGAGIVAGILLENWRVGKVDYLYRQSEIVLLDLRALGELTSSVNLDCDESIEQNRVFADRIFKEAELLAKYEGAQNLKEDLDIEHKKYDVLRSILWKNSIELRKKCKADFHTVVYIYDYNEPTIDTKAKQGVFSRVLSDLKEEKGSEIVLIPLAGDNNLSSVGLMMGLYNVSEQELPVVLIDEKTKINEVASVEDFVDIL